LDEWPAWGQSLVKVTLYVEGGGNQDKTKTACRKAFHTLVGKALGPCPRPKIVACGGRDEAHKRFCLSLNDTEMSPLLLVDSEDPVSPGSTASEYLRHRDHWKDLPDEQVHLMVQCVESWFLADKGALAKYYGQGFSAHSLPSNSKIEEVLKQDIANGLKSATRDTIKGEYHKTKHAFAILELINPEAVRKSSPYADRFFKALES
jgi:hypothetical protein